MSNFKLPISYNPIDAEKLHGVLDHYRNKLHSEIVRDFENQLSEISGAKHLVALNSGTASLHLALLALGVGTGDVVIAPTFTYVGTINPILHAGATPVFIDSERDTWNMDPGLLAQALSDLHKKSIKPRAIIVVHTYGMPAQMDEILDIAEQYDVPVLEDAAEALGSTYKSRKAGTLARLGIYSFNNNKIITTYGGGAILTDDAGLAKRVRFLASQARENLPYYEHRELGYNYLMGALNAAYGLAQLPELEMRVRQRREIFETCKTHLGGQIFQPEPANHYSNRWLPAVSFISPELKQRILKECDARKQEARPLWRPMHDQPLYRKYPFYGTKVSESLFESGLCLPVEMHSNAIF